MKPICTKAGYREYQQEVARRLEGLTHVSTGASPGCDGCSLEADASAEAIEVAGEPHFSWGLCDACGSSQGGGRHPAHGVSAEFGILHLNVCTDCVYYLNYGRLDDETMDKINTDREPLPFKVLLSHGPNHDIADGFDGYWVPTSPCVPRWQEVYTIGHASEVCREYIREWELGGGNWSGGKVIRTADNCHVARISFNGRCWDPVTKKEIKS
jgi:hypothetical protein